MAGELDGGIAALLLSGRRVALDGEQLSLGRASVNDVVLATERASRQHARIDRRADGFWLVDLASANGTYLNGERLSDQSRLLADGDALRIGDQTLRFVLEAPTRAMGEGDSRAHRPDAYPLDQRLRVGRDPRNDIVLTDPSASRFHLELLRENGKVTLRDSGSSNGTRLNGQLVQEGRVEVGAEIGVGSHRLLFDGESFVLRDDHGGLRLDAEQLTVVAGERKILDDASLSIKPGELVAIVGESGAGKSTLLKALAGVDQPTQGSVRVSGDPVRTRLTDLGYVPQDDIVHRLLTVTEALRFAGRLRLPEDATDADVEAAVLRVLKELGLTEHAAKRVDQLSGGQRKRVGVAIELLNRPGLLFLDEPTTGLDPGLEGQSMRLFRRLADNQRAVILVTHATRSLELCDRVVVMGRGGVIVFDGPPNEALALFEVNHFDEIYDRLASASGAWPQRVRPRAQAGETAADLPVSVGGGGRAPRRHVTRQVVVQVDRYARLLWRDTRNLLILGLQVPVLALAMVTLVPSGVFDRPGGDPQQAAQLLFLVLTTAIWFGAIDAAREIIKERAVLERERSVGLRLSAYLASKCVVLLTLSAVQTIVMATIVFAFRPLDEPATVALGLMAVLVLASWVSVGTGLLISASVRTEDQATSFIPLALLPQLLFAGALVPVETMGKIAEALSYAMFARWSFAGLGSAIDMNARIVSDKEFAPVSQYGTEFFDLSVGLALGVLTGFALVMLVLCRLRSRRV